MPSSSRSILACFAFERGDARVKKRVAALQAQGWEVKGYMFHRIRDKVDEPPFWDNVELGITENRRYLKRAFVLLFSLRILWQHRAALRQASIFYIVNTDNALLALAARWMARRPSGAAPLVLELADVQPAMLGQGVRGKLMRALERFVLRRTALLVTTSPGFVRNYFTPLQGFTGPVFLLENKVYPSTGIGQSAPDPDTLSSVTARLPARGGQPWVIGLFGAFRCRRSIELMRELAARFPDKLHFYLRGYPSGTDAPGIAALLEGLPNLEWGGAYQYPADLPDIYNRIDFNWTFDFADAGANSAWLLPNRIYEGGLFGCPALADAATETGQWVTDHAAGWTFAEPFAETLAAFFENLTLASWQEKQATAARLPHTLTCGEEDYAALSAALGKLAT
jgi:succinoglycan biosynthesis protein ExoL